MSAYTQKVSSAFTAPVPVQAILAPVRAGVELTTRSIVGEPEKLKAAAPQFTSIGSQVKGLAERANSEASGISGWDGPARTAFDSKVRNVAKQLKQLDPVFSELAKTLVQAANTSIQTANSIANTVRAVVTAITSAYRTAKAAALKTLGASMAAFTAWAVGKASQLGALVMKIARAAASLLQAISGAVDAAKNLAESIAKGLISLCEKLGLPGKAVELKDNVLGFLKDRANDAWESLKGEGKAERKKGNRFGEDKDNPDQDGKTGRWGTLKEKHEKEEREKAEGKDSKGLKPNVKADIWKGERKLDGYLEGHKKGEHEFDNGTKAEGDVGVDFGVKADGKVYADKDGIGGEAGVSSGLRASAKGSLTSADGMVSAEGNADAMLGGEAKAKGSLGKNGLDVGGEAFVGGKASVDGGVNVGGLGVGGSAEAWAGAGASADLNVGVKDGHFRVGGEVGAALGVGGKVGVNIDIDVNKSVDTVKRIGGSLVDKFH